MPQGWTPVAEPTAAPAGWTPVAEPDFKATNEPPSSSLWEKANTPLVPQILQAAHAISDFLTTPQADKAPDYSRKGLLAYLDNLGRTAHAQFAGLVGGSIEGAGDVAASFTTPVGIALLLSGLESTSTAARSVPGLKALLDLPAVKAAQRVVQATGGAAFAGHGAARVVTDPTLAGKAQGAVEMATGALGMASALPRPKLPNLAGNLDPEMGAAVKAGQAAGVPVDLATATGSTVVRGAQAIADRSLGGSMISESAQRRTNQALQDWRDPLVAQTNVQSAPAQAGAQTPETAGTNTRLALEAKQKGHEAAATTHYDRIDALAAQSPNAFPVDVKSVKPVLKKVLAQILELMPVAQEQQSTGVKALRNIIEAPDTMPLAQADKNLSALKTLARENGGVAKLAVSQLHAAVDRAAMTAGPAVVDALKQGRLETQAAKATEDVIGHLPGGHFEEPVKIVNQATAAGDQGISFLREIKRETPAQIPAIARAKLEQLADMGPDKALTEWRKLGSSSREILFPSPGHSQALDHFFMLNKAIGTNPNPSGSGHQAILAANLASLGTSAAAAVVNPIPLLANLGIQGTAATLSAMMHSPTVVRALTQAMVVSRSPVASGAARAAALASLSRAAQKAGILIPQTATSDKRP